MIASHVTAVMNSYKNKSSWLREAIRSYIKQEGVKLQLIVSTVAGDPAVAMAKKFGVECVVSPEPGIYSQLNNALRLVKGDWFVYASGNDKALPTKLADEVACCQKHKKHVCYSAFHYADEKLKITGKAAFYPYSYRKHLKGNFVSDCALMSRRILEGYRPFREQYGNHAYWDFWLRVAEAEPDVFVYNAKPTWIYRMGRSSQHIRRRRDPEWNARNQRSRATMLAAHRNRS